HSSQWPPGSLCGLGCPPPPGAPPLAVSLTNRPVTAQRGNPLVLPVSSGACAGDAVAWTGELCVCHSPPRRRTGHPRPTVDGDGSVSLRRWDVFAKRCDGGSQGGPIGFGQGAERGGAADGQNERRLS